MYTYKVNRKCFIEGALREPGGKHDPYRSDVKLDPCPSALELIKDAPKPKRRTKKDAAPQAPGVQGLKMKGEDVRFED